MGCTPAEEVSREPIRWSAVYPVAWEDLANCVARAASHTYRVTPLLNTRQRSAEVIIAIREGEIVQFIFEVKGLDGDRSEIALKRKKMAMDIEGIEAEQRTNAERCGSRV